MEYYILDEKKELKSVSMQEWDAWWKESRTTRKDRWYVADTNLPDIHIRTIFLRVSDLDTGYFETWVQTKEQKKSLDYGDFHNHKTWEEALAHHQEMVRLCSQQQA